MPEGKTIKSSGQVHFDPNLSVPERVQQSAASNALLVSLCTGSAGDEVDLKIFRGVRQNAIAVLKHIAVAELTVVRQMLHGSACQAGLK